jgi:hypothetical protein
LAAAVLAHSAKRGLEFGRPKPWCFYKETFHFSFNPLAGFTA